MLRAGTNLVAALVLLLTLATMAGAYTLVFRDGRRIEVPPEFVLTKTTLSYEVAPGISRTVQLILVDTAATERANNEVPGSFSKHGERKVATPVPQSSTHARTTLTNRELSTYRAKAP